MNFIKAYKYQLGITLTLIAIFFVFQNATCGGTDQSGSTTAASTSGSVTLTLAVSSTSVAINGTDQITASGGTPPYTYTVISGTGSINSSTGVFTAPGVSETDEIQVRDNTGAVNYTAVTVGSGSSTSTVSLTASTYNVAYGNTVQFTASGGTAPYTYSVLSGASSSTINSSTGLFTAPSTTTTVTVRAVDSVSNTAQAVISVSVNGSGSYPTTALGAAGFTLTIDHNLDFTYYNPAGAEYPILYLFGTNPAQGAGANCNPQVAALPCLQALSLTNFSNTTSYPNSYRGVISVSGRGGSSSIEYCISPSDTTKATVTHLSGNAMNLSNLQFLNNGLVLFSGAVSSTGYVTLDTQTGQASYSVNVTGQYSVHPDCSDLGSSFIQVQPW